MSNLPIETHFYLVRHGETDANRHGYVGGSTDDALTETGHAQAERVAAHLGDVLEEIDAVYSSPLKRAVQTADYVGKSVGLLPEIIDDLREWDAGEWETVEYSVIPTLPGFSPDKLTRLEFAPPGGESLGLVQRRVVAALGGIRERHAGGRVIVVGHGSALALAIAEFVDGELGAWLGYRLENCSVSELVLGEEPRLIVANGTAHLRD